MKWRFAIHFVEVRKERCNPLSESRWLFRNVFLRGPTIQCPAAAVVVLEDWKGLAMPGDLVWGNREYLQLWKDRVCGRSVVVVGVREKVRLNGQASHSSTDSLRSSSVEPRK